MIITTVSNAGGESNSPVDISFALPSLWTAFLVYFQSDKSLLRTLNPRSSFCFIFFAIDF